MKAFLWFMVILAGINTACVIWAAVTGTMTAVTPTARAVSAIVIAGQGAWALWLLARGG